MGFPPTLHLFSFMAFFCLVNLCCTSVFAQTADLYCGDDQYASSSPFDQNLHNILDSISSSIGDSGYYSNSTGTDPDTVYVKALCRADTQLEDCRNCISRVAQDILQNCSYSMNAYVWHTWCILRVSNSTTYWNEYDSSNNATCVSTDPSRSNPEIPDSELGNLDSLLNVLARSASSHGDSPDLIVASDNFTGDPVIYSMVQCMPDLYGDDCLTCLENALQIRISCVDSSYGTVILTPRCFLQYETYPFYDSTRLQQIENIYYNTDSPPAPAPSTETVLPPAPAPSTETPPPPETSTQPPSPPRKKHAHISSPSPPPLPPPPPPRRSNVIIPVAVTVPLIVVLFLLIGGFIFMKMRSKGTVPPGGVQNEINTTELQYRFDQIKASTREFSSENILGSGGYGTVYKGQLRGGQEIAVKRLSAPSAQGHSDFKNEVELLAGLRHKNLVRLFGFSTQGSERILVYEFFKNRSLDYFIFDRAKRFSMDWNIRSKIIDGIAHGLQYLHQEIHFRIIHRDLKASNILLDEQMNPKIADFGVARLLLDATRENTYRIVGTQDYMAPEYKNNGEVSPKIDVYSFGVLVLEIISGQKIRLFAVGGRSEDMLAFAWKNWKDGTAENMIDPMLRDDTQSLQSIFKCIQIGLLCVQENPIDRPTMASVIHMLESLVINLPVPSQPKSSKTNSP